MQMTAAVAIGTVVDLIGGKNFVNGLGSMGNIRKEEITLFL